MIERKSEDRKKKDKKITNREHREKAKLKEEEKAKDEEKREVSRTDLGKNIVTEFVSASQ